MNELSKEQLAILDSLVLNLDLWLRSNYELEVVEIGHTVDGCRVEDIGWAFFITNDFPQEVAKIKEHIQKHLNENGISPGTPLYLQETPSCFPDLTTRTPRGNFTEAFGWISFYACGGNNG